MLRCQAQASHGIAFWRLVPVKLTLRSSLTTARCPYPAARCKAVLYARCPPAFSFTSKFLSKSSLETAAESPRSAASCKGGREKVTKPDDSGGFSSLFALQVSGKSSSPSSKSFPRLAVNDVYKLRLPVCALFASLTDIISRKEDKSQSDLLILEMVAILLKFVWFPRTQSFIVSPIGHPRGHPRGITRGHPSSNPSSKWCGVGTHVMTVMVRVVST